MSDLSLFLSLLLTTFLLYGTYHLIDLYLCPVYASDDAGSGRWLIR